jgi:sigma-B regulation protein RsbU (phosphoserine phosphatase)
MPVELLSTPPSTILVVDDTPTNLQVLVRTLEGSGHRILAAKDGATAIDIATRAKPDLMLLDVMMPGMDGFEVCRVLKSKPETRHTLIIFLSARGEVADKVSALALGAVDYITKPIQAEEVLARVAVHLSRQHLTRELRRSRDRLDKELAGAAQMQRQLLPPQLPSHHAISFGSYYQTSRHAGGDYYDVLPLYGDRIGILVADVSGHGAPAAIVMAMIRAVVHSYPGVPDDPPKLLRYINSHFDFLWETPMYATAVYAVIDPSTRTMKMSSAGHPAPLKTSSSGSVESVPLENAMCLLWHEMHDVPCIEIPLQKDDRFLFFTDGITDRQSTDGTMFDLERLSAALAKHRERTPPEIATAIVAELDAFSAGQEPDDDQTLLVAAIDDSST